MRNLKRALSLILAAAMLIGMMVVGAGAVSYNDFPDRDEIVNKDAVSMLTTLEIIKGTDQGTFDPTGNVDRAQMAKMISVMLTNNENADDLYMSVDSGLTDIASNWARGYINYCYVRGIIAGRGDNTFDPSANVTAVEAAKMLLTALGYDAATEGLVGTDWALNTSALAHELGIFRNFTKDVNEPLNRDDAALLIYNTLDVELIQEYRNGYAISYDDHRTILSSVFGVMRVEGVVVGNEWAQLEQTDSEAALREGRTTLENVVVYDSTTANTVVDEGVRYDGVVPFNVTTPVEYMGKAVTLYVEKTTVLSNSKVIGVATKDDMNVINFTAEGQDTVKDYLKGTGVSVDADTEYYVNYGYFESDVEAIDWINDHYWGEEGNDFNLNGIEVQVIDNNDDGTAEYVLYLQETLSEVNRYNASKETLAFYTPDRDARSELNGDHATVTIDLADMVSAESVSLDGVITTDALELAAEDLILYVQYGGRTYVSLPEIVTGTMTRVDRDKDNELYITVNDATYYQSYILDAASMVDVDITHFDIDDARNIPGFDDAYDFILDSHGYVVAIRPAEDIVTNYALVLDSAWTQNALKKEGQVKVLMADGTEGTYYIDWDESAKAFAAIDTIKEPNDAFGKTHSQRLESYLGSRDVVQDPDGAPEPDLYRTGRATGSVIEYSLNEAGDLLTIERVLQGNNLVNDLTSLEIDGSVNPGSTAGVGDNRTILYMDGDPDNHTNLQYTATYDNGTGNITVTASDSTNEDMVGRGNASKNYAVDLDTVAFYYYEKRDGSYEWGVATGWDKMSDVKTMSDVQVYPVLEKTTNRTYKASNLADVILFEAEPNTVAANYMLVLSANAIGKDLLELNVVFEDGTAETIEIDDQGDFDEENQYHFMRAWSYSENADGTYDIGTMWQRFNGVADLLINQTIDLNDGTYLSLPASASIWDVTEVKDSGDDVPTGTFRQNVYVNTVVIVSEGQIRTAWIWDTDGDSTIGGDYNFNWDLTNYVDVYPLGGGYGAGSWTDWQIAQAFAEGKSVRYWGDLSLVKDLYIPEGIIFQVEGDVVENGANDVIGFGTLRVRNDYQVGTKGTVNGDITVNTQVGGNLFLAEDTAISSRVGVFGSIIGTSAGLYNPAASPVCGNCVENLTVNNGSSVFVNGDVLVYDLTVLGHIEARDFHVENDLYVLSSNTLIARNDVYAHGDVVIGGVYGTSSCTGAATVAGDLTVLGNLTVNGATNATKGVLTLGSNSNVKVTGDLDVYQTGEINQPFSTNGNIQAATIDIYGDVNVSGDVLATAVNGTLTVYGGGALNTNGDINAYWDGGKVVIYDTANITGNLPNTTADESVTGQTSYAGTSTVSGGSVAPTLVTLTVNATGANVLYNGTAVTGPISVAPNATVELVITPAEGYDSVATPAIATGDATVKAHETAANTWVVTMGTTNATLTVTGMSAENTVTVVPAGNAVKDTDYTIAPESFDRTQAATITVTPVEGGAEITSVTCDVNGVTFTKDTATGVWTAPVAANTVAEGTNSITVTVTKASTPTTDAPNAPDFNVDEDYDADTQTFTLRVLADTKQSDLLTYIRNTLNESGKLAEGVTVTEVVPSGGGYIPYNGSTPISGVNVTVQKVFGVALDDASNVKAYAFVDSVNSGLVLEVTGEPGTEYIAAGTSKDTGLPTINTWGDGIDVTAYVNTLRTTQTTTLVLKPAVKITLNGGLTAQYEGANGFTDFTGGSYVAVGTNMKVTGISTTPGANVALMNGTTQVDTGTVNADGDKVVYEFAAASADMSLTETENFSMTINGEPVDFSYDDAADEISFLGGEGSYGDGATLAGKYIAVKDGEVFVADNVDNAVEVTAGDYTPTEGFAYTISCDDLSKLRDKNGNIVLVKAIELEIGQDEGTSSSYFTALRLGDKDVATVDGTVTYFVQAGASVDFRVANSIYEAGKLAVSYNDGEEKCETITTINAKYWGTDLKLVIAMANEDGVYAPMKTNTVDAISSAFSGFGSTAPTVTYSVNGAQAVSDVSTLRVKAGDKITIRYTVADETGVQVATASDSTAGKLAFTSTGNTVDEVKVEGDTGSAVDSIESGTVTFKADGANAYTIAKGTTFVVTCTVESVDSAFALTGAFTAATT